jgi:hypothetical protein
MALGWTDLLILGGSQLLSGIMGSNAAEEAAGLQAGAAAAGIEEQRRQFDRIQEILKPYVQAGQQALPGFTPYQTLGTEALAQQRAIAGLAGPEAQAAAIQGIESSPLYQAQVRQGEEAMLARASATGGLRGGNLQAALAQFRPQMLGQAIESQYNRFGGLAGAGYGASQRLAELGQASAGGTAAAGSTMATNVSNLLQQQGAAQAGGALGQAGAFQGLMNLPAGLIGAQIGAGGKMGLGFGSLFGR